MKKYNAVAVGTVLIAVLVFAAVVALAIGAVPILPAEICHIIIAELSGNVDASTALSDPRYAIIWELRLPRIILAMCVGGGLAVCGLIMQAIVKNPLADPYILGISSGASLGATLAVLLGIGMALGENAIGIAAFVGAFLLSIAVIGIANVGGRANSVKLLLAGMALSAVCGALSGFVIFWSGDSGSAGQIVFWLMGSIAGAKWSMLAVIVPIVCIGILFFWSQSRLLNLMLLGDETAITLGADLHIYRQMYLPISALIVGFIVYASGVVGFVGLLVPHAVRMFVRNDHRVTIPIAALVGAIFLVVADICCRTLIPRTELPIGLFISAIGAPCFVYLMIRKRYTFGGRV